MKAFIQHQLSIPECLSQLDKFEKVLKANTDLKERKDILPFFRKNLQIASLISTYVPGITNPDRIAIEYDIFGDFTCDLAVGDSVSKTFLLVEFEDAVPQSLFSTKGTKATPEWGSRVEHGFSQVVDWFWKLSDMGKTIDYESRFGARQATFHGMVVVGRDQSLGSREENRLRWRQDHSIVHSQRISIITFDQLARDLRYRLSTYMTAAVK